MGCQLASQLSSLDIGSFSPYFFVVFRVPGLARVSSFVLATTALFPWLLVLSLEELGAGFCFCVAFFFSSCFLFAGFFVATVFCFLGRTLADSDSSSGPDSGSSLSTSSLLVLFTPLVPLPLLRGFGVSFFSGRPFGVLFLTCFLIGGLFVAVVFRLLAGGALADSGSDSTCSFSASSFLVLFTPLVPLPLFNGLGVSEFS